MGNNELRFLAPLQTLKKISQTDYPVCTRLIYLDHDQSGTGYMSECVTARGDPHQEVTDLVSSLAPAGSIFPLVPGLKKTDFFEPSSLLLYWCSATSL